MGKNHAECMDLPYGEESIDGVIVDVNIGVHSVLVLKYVNNKIPVFV